MLTTRPHQVVVVVAFLGNVHSSCCVVLCSVVLLCNFRGAAYARGLFTHPSFFFIFFFFISTIYPFRDVRAQYFRVECSHGYNSVGPCLAKPTELAVCGVKPKKRG